MRSWWLIWLAVAAAVAACQRRQAAGRAADAGLSVIPALAAGDEGALTLVVETERIPEGRRLQVRLGEGEAVVVLNNPGPAGEHGIAFGSGSLQSIDRTRGEKLVAGIARWLGEPVPPPATVPGELTPMPFHYVRIGAENGWEANKLFLERGGHSAEVYLNLSGDGRTARLLEKDEEYRKDLIAFLLEALRDGRRPRRTPLSDRNFASAAPLVGETSPVVGGEHTSDGTWLGESYFAASSAPPWVLREWRAFDAPPRQVAMLDGRAVALMPAPRNRLLALSVVYPTGRIGYSTGDPAAVMLTEVNRWNVRVLVRRSREFRYIGGMPVVWSPDGEQLAVAGATGERAPQLAVTRVYSVATGHLIATTEPALDVSPTAWTAAGLL